ncbi:MAG: PD-(D/E)XK nuclease family protein [Treponema sp.]|jgi:hypothetical protein|nr:PD-(D/E)XK nuclease family protein [Treponema sp.]
MTAVEEGAAAVMRRYAAASAAALEGVVYQKIRAAAGPDIRKLPALRGGDAAGSFNLFKDLSPGTYHHELYHSRILERLLSPQTPEIYDRRYLQELVSLLRSKNKNVRDHDFGDNYTVRREEGKIDVFIYDDTHGIIIENKINNAPDQDNQLARYYEYAAKVRKKEITAVVYLPLDGEKWPPLKSYTGKYKKFREEIEALLVRLPAVSGDEKGDYAHGFLDKCADIAGAAGNRTALVFIEQYSKLVKEIGRRQVMAKSVEKKILKKLLDKNIKTSLEELDELADIWKRKDALLNEVVSDELRAKLGLEEKENAIGKPINDEVRLEYWPWERWLGFSVNKKKTVTPETREKLEELLSQKDFAGPFFTEGDNTAQYTGKYFNIGEFSGSLDEAAALIAEKFNLLEKKARSVL